MAEAAPTADELVDLKWKANLIDRIYVSRDAVEIANKAVLCRYVEATNVGDLDELGTRLPGTGDRVERGGQDTDEDLF